MVSPLLQLPDELLVWICDACPTARDKAALASTHRHLYELLDPALYRYNVECQDASGFMWAAQHGRLDLLEKFHNAGAEVNDTSASYSMPPLGTPHRTVQPAAARRVDVSFSLLHAAVREGRDDAVEWLLDHGARVNAPGRGVCMCQAHLDALYMDIEEAPWLYDGSWHPGWSPLHLAICNGRASTVRLLVSRGASSVTTKNKGDRITALHSAALCGNVSMVEYLLQKWPETLNMLDRYGHNALHYAAVCFGPDEVLPALINLLVTSGVHMEHESSSSLTPLLVACRASCVHAAVLLVEAGAAPTGMSDGLTPLHLALLPRDMFLNHTAVDDEAWHLFQASLVRRLAQDSGLIDQTAEEEQAGFGIPRGGGDTPLMMACMPGKPVILVAILLDAGADVNAIGSGDRTALTIAATDPNADRRDEKLILLLRRGARLDLRDKSRYLSTSALETILDVNPYLDSQHPLRVILDNCTENNVSQKHLDSVARAMLDAQNFTIFKALVEKGARVINISDREMNEIVTCLADDDEVELLEWFFDKIFPWAELNDQLIVRAVEHHYFSVEIPPIVEMLLRRGQAPVNGRDELGETALYAACSTSNISLLKALVERGAEVNTFNRGGETALCVAVEQEWSEGVECLMKNGAHPFIVRPNPDGIAFTVDVILKAIENDTCLPEILSNMPASSWEQAWIDKIFENLLQQPVLPHFYDLFKLFGNSGLDFNTVCVKEVNLLTWAIYDVYTPDEDHILRAHPAGGDFLKHSGRKNCRGALLWSLASNGMDLVGTVHGLELPSASVSKLLAGTLNGEIVWPSPDTQDPVSIIRHFFEWGPRDVAGHRQLVPRSIEEVLPDISVRVGSCRARIDCRPDSFHPSGSDSGFPTK